MKQRGMFTAFTDVILSRWFLRAGVISFIVVSCYNTEIPRYQSIALRNYTDDPITIDDVFIDGEEIAMPARPLVVKQDKSSIARHVYIGSFYLKNESVIEMRIKSEHLGTLNAKAVINDTGHGCVFWCGYQVDDGLKCVCDSREYHR